ncbi:MAG: hypothetical protein AAGE61_09870 [Pseudomonadota bacterium]
MAELGAIGAVNTQPQVNDAQAKGPPQGVGALKSLWLNMTGQATSAQSKQLESLKEFVTQKFGNEGLKTFESWKADNVSTATRTGGWSSMVSDSEIKGLINNLEFKETVQSYAKNSLKVIDNLPKARLMLLQHTMKEFSPENTCFISKFSSMPMNEFMKAPDSFPNERLSEFPSDQLEKTMLDYVTNPNESGLKFEVNVSYATRQEAKLALANYQEAKDNGNDQDVHDAKRDLISALGKSRTEVVKMMNVDSVGRIKTNPEYLKAIQEDILHSADPKTGLNDLPPLADPTDYNADQVARDIKNMTLHYQVLDDLERE